MDCAVDADPKPEIIWYRGDSPLYLSDNIHISSDGQWNSVMAGMNATLLNNDFCKQLAAIGFVQRGVLFQQITIRGAQVSDGGKYTCRATNEAGSADIDLTLKILIPPSIDKSNIIGNPLAIVGRSIYLECPVTGIPQPKVTWFKEGNPIDVRDQRILVDQNNQTFGILHVETKDEGRYYCVAENRGGKSEQEFNLEVVVPPQMETTELQRFTKREQDTLTLWCPVKNPPDSAAMTEIFWYKDVKRFFQISSDGRRLQLTRTTLADAGNYSCIALNRAGESSLEFDVEILCRNLATQKCRELETKHLYAYRKVYERRRYELWKHNQKIQNVMNKQSLETSDEHIRNSVHHRPAPPFMPTINVPVISTVIISGDSSSGKVTVRATDHSSTLAEVQAHPVQQHSSSSFHWDARQGSSSNAYVNNTISNRVNLEVTLVQAPSFPDGSINMESERNINVDGTAAKDAASPTVGEHEQTSQRTPDFVFEVHKAVDDRPTVDIPASLKSPSQQHQINSLDIRPTALAEISTLSQFDSRHPTERVPKVHAEHKQQQREQTVSERQRYYEALRRTQLEERQRQIDQAQREYEARLEAWRRENDPKQDHGSSKDSKYRSQEQFLGAAVEERNEKHLTDSSKRRRLPDDHHLQRSNHSTVHIGDRGIDSNKDGIMQIGVEKNLVVDSNFRNVHKIRRPHHQYHHRKHHQPHHVSHNRKQIDRSSSFEHPYHRSDLNVKSDHLDSKSSTQRENTGRKTDERERISSNRWGGKFLLYQTEWQPWDPDYSDTEWSQWYSYNNAIESTRRRRPAPKVDGSRNDAHPHVAVGRPITIWCIASGHPFPIIKWLKDGKVENGNTDDAVRILENGQGSSVIDYFFQCSTNIQTVHVLLGNDHLSSPPKKEISVQRHWCLRRIQHKMYLISFISALEIISAKAEHSGIWTCEAENDAGKTELEFNLDVWTPPIVKIDSDNTIRALDSSITLHCHASGNPQPTLSWSMAGQPLMSSAEGARISLKGTRLDIPRLKQSHVGDYTCSARNDAGSAEASIHVDVLVPPVISRDNVEMSPRLPTGQTLTLLCDASGKPFPELDWYINGTVVQESSGNLIMGEDGRYLQINNISLADRGVYRCVARNVAGRDELLYNVAIVQAPIILNGGTQQVIEGEVAKITCNAYGEPIPVITWQRNGVRVETGMRYIAEDKILTVIETRSSDSGIYVCVATNEAGTTQQAFTLEVLGNKNLHSLIFIASFSPRIVTTSPNESVVPINNPFSLKCGARGYPYPEITWTIDDQPVEEELKGRFSIADDGTLFIEKVAKKAVHTFKCTATNDAGTDEKEYMVKLISSFLCRLIISNGHFIINVLVSIIPVHYHLSFFNQHCYCVRRLCFYFSIPSEYIFESPVFQLRR
ncbi:unnamed protein product [Anisakis simplex]|uniref:Hemicentin-1 (inferred by orthology to a human protein) n=1 Tax=Anisakis simplex TaxID=6269 RepID=A0A158PPS0_ANISI|nr:unnamed protein product [Anisakis simplex]